MAALVAVGAPGVDGVGAQEQPCDAKFGLATGDPTVTDGALNVVVDAVGRFGGVYAAAAVFNPAGDAPAGSSVYSSDVITNVAGQFVACGSATGIEVVTATATEVVTRWRAGGLEVELTQSVRRSGDVGSVLSQTYVMSNPEPTRRPLTVLRHVDGDLLFDGTIDDGGAATQDGAVLYEFDSSDDPDEPSTYVGIVGSLDQRVTPNRWTIQAFPFLGRLLELLGVPQELHGRIALDADGDRIVDQPYDVTLTQQWDGFVPGLGEAVFRSDTRFGRVPPDDVAEEPVVELTTDRQELLFPEQLGLTTSQPQVVTARNSGTEDVTISRVLAQGPAASDLVVADSCAGESLAPRESCTVSVRFRPTAAGVRDASLRFDTTAVLAPPVVPVRGTGATPSLIINPAVVHPGRVTDVTGRSFPPGQSISLTWVDPVTLTATGGFPEPVIPVTAKDDGTFQTRVVVFPNSRIGGRALMAKIDGFVATHPFLVAAGTSQGPDFIPRR